ncbi:glycosyltransferase, partial [uncultured Parasutterella sp.]
DSRTVEKDLIDFLSEKKLKLNNSYWFYPGSNFVQNVSTSGITAQQSLYLRNLKKFKYNFLMVGTIEPRKGHAIILDLFTYLWEVEKDNVSLTFIGKEGWMVRDLIDNFKKTKYFNQNFYWFNDASDSFLDQCYKQTDAVIVASLNEGYGLPILEAAQRNCRIIANDIPIFREVAPKECYFLNLTTPAIALKQLQEWLKKPSSICQTSKTKTWKESTAQIIGKTNLI